MRFTKTQAQGNDFIFLETGDRNWLKKGRDLALKWCDRHRGIGSDGLVFLVPESGCQGRMVMYNPDGSRSPICGNALRCCALFLQPESPGEFSFTSEAGFHRGMIHKREQNVADVSVSLGRPGFEEDPQITLKLTSGTVYGTSLSMGNPHAIFFSDQNPEAPPFSEWAREVELHPRFPLKTNATWVVPLGEGEFRATVWERGAGWTPACGSGACAVHAAARRRGFTGAESLIRMTGGPLKITENLTGELWLRGEVHRVFQGELPLTD